MSLQPIKFKKISDPVAYYESHVERMRDLFLRAFDTNSAHLFSDLEQHFREAEYGQLFIERGRPIGVALYRNLGDDTLWLQGIGVDPDYQGRGIGFLALSEAARGFGSLVARTRNPAVVALVGKVMDKSCPDIRLTDPLRHLQDPLIRQLFDTFASDLGANPALRPFIWDCYPEDLYRADPGRDMPFSIIRQNPESALMVVGLKTV